MSFTDDESKVWFAILILNFWLLNLVVFNHFSFFNVKSAQSLIEACFTKINFFARRALKACAPNRLVSTSIALMVLVQYVFIGRILNEEELGWIDRLNVLMQTAMSDCRIIISILKFIIAYRTKIKICNELRFVSMTSCNDLFLTFVAIDKIFPSTFDVILTELISQRDPARSQVVVSREQLNLLGTRH